VVAGVPGSYSEYLLVPILSICGVSRKRYDCRCGFWAKRIGMARSDDGETWAFPINTGRERFGNETHYRAEETRTEGGSFGTSQKHGRD